MQVSNLRGLAAIVSDARLRSPRHRRRGHKWCRCRHSLDRSGIVVGRNVLAISHLGSAKAERRHMSVSSPALYLPSTSTARLRALLSHY
eukprot:9490400-Pyramimonas_sp.AAC.1